MAQSQRGKPDKSKPIHSIDTKFPVSSCWVPPKEKDGKGAVSYTGFEIYGYSLDPHELDGGKKTRISMCTWQPNMWPWSEKQQTRLVTLRGLREMGLIDGTDNSGMGRDRDGSINDYLATGRGVCPPDDQEAIDG